MTRPLTLGATTSASGVAKGVEVSPVVCECGGSPRSPREQWTFTGRESHWGFTYLVWTRDDGKRFARVIW